uniref:HP domain-containing protein n=1 Tax=Panagrellus redivivus TaxID=6233 RepID=A0A7E5A113_PANRE
MTNSDGIDFAKEKGLTAPGLKVWMIESLKSIVQVPDTDHGVFDDTLTYLALYTNRDKTSKVFFWIGESATLDRQCVAAFLATQLERYVKCYGTYRETQNHESKFFLEVFHRLRYFHGDTKTGILRKLEFDTPKRLYQVKGRNTVRVVEVPLKVESLNTDDAFILDTGDEDIYVWFGRTANCFERCKAGEVARDIRDQDHGGRCTVNYIEGRECFTDRDFFAHLNAKPQKIPAVAESTSDEQFEKLQRPLRLFCISDASGQLTITELNPPFTQDSLDTQDCFILDSGSNMTGIFAWVGRGCTELEKTDVFNKALKYLRSEDLPSYTPICKVSEGLEPMLFRDLMQFPRASSSGTNVGKGCTVGLELHPLSKVAKVDSNEKFDATKMHRRTESSLTKLVQENDSPYMDDHTVEIGRIEKFDIHPVPIEDYGRFYSGDAYVIRVEDRRRIVMYSWLGSHCTIDERMAAAFSLRNQNMDTGGKELKNYDIIQFKEPPHFSRLFGGILIYLKGGHDSGFKSMRASLLDKAAAKGAKEEVKLFQIREKTVNEIAVDSSNLNSNDVFGVLEADRLYIWIGKGANQAEISVSKLLPRLLRATVFDIIDEGDEPDEFWDAIGGQKEYATGGRLEDANASCTARLFHCSNAKGKFHVEEVFSLTQSDLETDDIMILDAFTEIYIWIGAGSNAAEKKSALKTVMEYIASDSSGRSNENLPILVVDQGKEPQAFRAHFGAWDDMFWINGLNDSQLRTLVESTESQVFSPVDGRELLSNFNKIYTVEELRVPIEELPFGVDPAKKEEHLNDTDFIEVLGIDREAFYKLPKWRQNQRKVAAGIF